MNSCVFNKRMKLSLWLISMAIKTLPEKWQMKIAIKNLIDCEMIKTYEVVG